MIDYNNNPFVQIKKDIHYLQSNLQLDPNVQKLKISQHHRKSYQIHSNNQINKINQINNQPINHQSYQQSLKQKQLIHQKYKSIYQQCQNQLKQLSKDLLLTNQLQNNPLQSQQLIILQNHINYLKQENSLINQQNQIIINKLAQAMKLMEKYQIIITKLQSQGQNLINQQIAQENQILWIKIQDYQTRLQDIIQKVSFMEKSNINSSLSRSPERSPQRQYITNQEYIKNFAQQYKKTNKKYLDSLNFFHQSMKNFQERFKIYVQSSENSICQVINIRRSALNLQQNINNILSINQRTIGQYAHLKQKNKELNNKLKASLKENNENTKKLQQKINGYDLIIRKLTNELQIAVMYNDSYNNKRYNLGVYSQNNSAYQGKQNQNKQYLLNNFKQIQSKMHNISQQIININKISKQQLIIQKTLKQQLQYFKKKCKQLQQKVLQLQKSNLQYQLIPISKKNQQELKKQLLLKSQQILQCYSQIKRLKNFLAEQQKNTVKTEQNIKSRLKIFYNQNYNVNFQKENQELIQKYQQACVALQKNQAMLIHKDQQIVLITQQYNFIKQKFDKTISQVTILRQQNLNNKIQINCLVNQNKLILQKNQTNYLKRDSLTQSISTISRKHEFMSPDMIPKLQIQIQYKNNLILEYQKQLQIQKKLLNQYLTHQIKDSDFQDSQMANQRIFILNSKIDTEKQNIKAIKYKIREVQLYQQQIKKQQYLAQHFNINPSIQELIEQIKKLQHKLYQANKLNSQLHMTRINRQIENNSNSHYSLEKIMEDYEYTKKNLDVYRDKNLLQQQVIQNLRKQIKYLKQDKSKDNENQYDKERHFFNKQKQKQGVLKKKKQEQQSNNQNKQVDFNLTAQNLQQRLIAYKNRQNSKKSLSLKLHEQQSNTNNKNIIQTQSKYDTYSISSNAHTNKMNPNYNSDLYVLGSSKTNSINIISDGVPQIRENENNQRIKNQDVEKNNSKLNYQSYSNNFNNNLRKIEENNDDSLQNLKIE